jgi:hypothetical protein
MTTNRFVYITAYWNDKSFLEPFKRTCVVWAKKLGSRSTISDDEVFYYFEHDEAILGNHGDFTVTAYEEDGGYVPS